jgi:hypothetical protein
MPAGDETITTGEQAVTFLRDHAVYPPDAKALPSVDMVMKGGITSGVVYPLAVCQLARERTFRNLGGSSAGGIAAAMAAAAELARAHGGFKRLAALPDELGSNLQAIFQPSKVTRPLFSILMAGLDKTWRKWPKVVAAVVRGAFLWFAPVVAVVLALLWPALDDASWWTVVFAVVLAVFLGLLTAVLGVALTGKKRLEKNGYGVCRGSNGQKGTRPGAVEPFTDWLHTKLQEVAGLGDEVLTFGHLWGDKALDHSPEACAIRLEMMTTNVTHCRPVRLPFESDAYYFCPVELADYFPKPVYDHIVEHSRPSGSGEQWTCPEHEVPLRHLPHPGRLPVVVAVRMTLSFPGLISAVPLFDIDRAAKPQHPLRCWFSDGGISSNFPIHFFDSLLPKHPTFGISLGPYPKGREDQHVYLRRAGHTARPRARGTDSLVGFVTALFDTLQNWSDEGQATLPGFRDRIVEVRHGEAEGGMNLNMSREQVMSMCFRGYLAAKELDRFNFAHHRWARYRTAMAQLAKAAANIKSKYADVLPNGEPGYREFVTALPPDSGEDPGPTWREKAVARTDLLLAFAGGEPDFDEYEPKPSPDLRIVAHF